MSNLINYLNALDKDAVAREAHKKDPRGAMKKFGLSYQEQEAMMPSDAKKVAVLVGIRDDELPYIQVTEGTYRDQAYPRYRESPCAQS